MSSYRARALTNYPPVCDICKADGEPLDAHHRDGNHADDSITNLQLLCAPCHTAEHIRMRHGSDEGYGARVFCRLSPSDDAELRAVAKEMGVAVSEVVRIAIKEYLDRHKAAKVLDPARDALMAGALR